MALKELRLPTETVEVPGSGEFTVRGLSLVDTKPLVRKHAGELSSLFNLISNSQKSGEIDIEDAALTAARFLDQAPALMADIIAIASGEEDAFEAALQLPIPVQVDALTKIGRLTFASEGSVKKFLQTVIVMMGSLRDERKS